MFREKLLYRLLFLASGKPQTFCYILGREKRTAIYYLFTKANFHLRVSGVLVEHAPLEEVYIFFDTATYDQIERDVKVDIATFARIQ